MKTSDLPTCNAEGCDKPAFVQDLGAFTDPPGTERWWCEDHAGGALPAHLDTVCCVCGAAAGEPCVVMYWSGPDDTLSPGDRRPQPHFYR